MAPYLFLITWWILWLCPHPRRTAYKYTWYTFLSLSLVSAFFATLSAYNDVIHPQVILKDESAVYIGPDKSYGTTTTLAAGSIVRLYQKQTDWCKIKRYNLTGWVPTEHIKGPCE
jgi:uncharacterized protein YraI